ncbi:TPA: hypothetical protein ACH3X1_003960 [Trebouxia sp. C0004]
MDNACPPMVLQMQSQPSKASSFPTLVLHAVVMRSDLKQALHALCFHKRFAGHVPGAVTADLDADSPRFQQFCCFTGKAGAIVGAFAIGKAFLEGGMSLQATLGILAATNLLGLVCTAFVPEAKRLSLQDANKTQSLFGKLVHRCTGTWQAGVHPSNRCLICWPSTAPDVSKNKGHNISDFCNFLLKRVLGSMAWPMGPDKP